MLQKTGNSLAVKLGGPPFGIHKDTPESTCCRQALNTELSFLHLLKKQPFQRDFPEYTKIYKKKLGKLPF